MKIEFIIPGPPRQQERWRKGQNGQPYDPSAKAKESFALQAISRIGRIEPLCGPLKLSAVYIFDGRGDVDDGAGVMMKPDLDNMNKFVMDALEGFFYQNDAQIVEIGALKIYGPKPQTEIVIIEWEK